MPFHIFPPKKTFLLRSIPHIWELESRKTFKKVMPFLPPPVSELARSFPRFSCFKWNVPNTGRRGKISQHFLFSRPVSKNFPSTNNASIVKFRNVTRRHINYLKNKKIVCWKYKNSQKWANSQTSKNSMTPLLLFPFSFHTSTVVWHCDSSGYLLFPFPQARLSLPVPSTPQFPTFFAQGKRKEWIRLSPTIAKVGIQKTVYHKSIRRASIMEGKRKRKNPKGKGFSRQQFTDLSGHDRPFPEQKMRDLFFCGAISRKRWKGDRVSRLFPLWMAENGRWHSFAALIDIAGAKKPFFS